MSTSAIPQILVDGRAVDFIVDSSCPFSSCPADLQANSPSHVQSLYSDGFTFSTLVDLHSSSSLSSLVLSCNWINAETSACQGVWSICWSLFIHFPAFVADPGSLSKSSVVACTSLSPSMLMAIPFSLSFVRGDPDIVNFDETCDPCSSVLPAQSKLSVASAFIASQTVSILYDNVVRSHGKFVLLTG